MAKLSNEWPLNRCLELSLALVDKSKQFRDKQIVEALCYKVRMRKIFLELNIF